MKNPFIAGNWVRGDNFYGRRQLIAEILEGDRDFIWVAGTRRLGKTSLLKQLEYLAGKGEGERRYISLFWDLQGSNDLDGLRESFIESVEDAEERFAGIGVSIDDLEEKSLFEGVRHLRRQARSHEQTLLLLCDEAEELLNIGKHHPEALPRLRRAFQHGDHLRTVLTATKRLMHLEKDAPPNTSPFLHGFIPPAYLLPLETDAADALLRQGGFSPADAAEIKVKTHCHPYLMQMIGKQHFEKRDLPAVIQGMRDDEMVFHFFAVDFEYLDATEKRAVEYVLNEEGITAESLAEKTALRSDNISKIIHGLVQLGYLRQEGRQLKIANYFFEKWLQRERGRIFQSAADDGSSGVSAVGPASETEVRFSPKKEFSESLIGRTLKNYKVIESIGQGGMGQVFKAQDIRLERFVALKLLATDMLNDAEFRQRFFSEARAASALNHPNIATIYEIDEAFGLLYIAMEFIDGVTLGSWRPANPLSLRERLKVAEQIAAGLKCAHDHGVVHRDIKPENIMVDRRGTVKIMDFGLAKRLTGEGQNLTRTGATLGTPAYMSPEQVAGKPVDHRSDIYSLGVLYFVLFSGSLPYNLRNEAAYIYAIVHEQPPRASSINPIIPEQLDELLAGMLAKDREARFQKMDQVIEALNGIEATGPPAKGS